VVEIISWSSTFTNAVFIDYEPARFDDAFGATMLKNLEVSTLFAIHLN
jgi:hypothetical protein